MKIIDIITSKGEWLLVDGEYQAYKLWGNKNFITKLSEITEEQASEVVEELSYGQFKNYRGLICLGTAIESLHSLIKSKGIYLYENPAPLLDNSYKESESKTFYNPYLFKR